MVFKCSGDISLSNLVSNAWGLFTNYVYKRRGVGTPKMLIFVNVHKVKNVTGGGKWSKKSQKIVNVVCEQPLAMIIV